MTPPLVRKNKNPLETLRVLHAHYQRLLDKGMEYLRHRVMFLDRLMRRSESGLMRDEMSLSRTDIVPRAICVNQNRRRHVSRHPKKGPRVKGSLPVNNYHWHTVTAQVAAVISPSAVFKPKTSLSPSDK
ncbi:hypothetical protein J6590_009398 [Homalodisca vitripennis]|nr:hypothetical protein J6590_009398 [Homalodisca vitripennis]